MTGKQLNQTSQQDKTLTINLKVSNNEYEYLKTLAQLYQKTYNSFEEFLQQITRDAFDDFLFDADNIKNTLRPQRHPRRIQHQPKLNTPNKLSYFFPTKQTVLIIKSFQQNRLLARNNLAMTKLKTA